MPSLHFHIERLSELLQREIGTIIAREMRDPRIPAVVTVTHVKLAQDTRNATVYVSIFGEPDTRKSAIDALNGAAPFIQKLLSSRVSIKHFPRLYFKLDNSLEQGHHINELLKEIQDDLE